MNKTGKNDKIVSQKATELVESASSSPSPVPPSAPSEAGSSLPASAPGSQNNFRFPLSNFRSSPSRPLSEFEIQSIDLFVRIAHLVGIPKSVGEIYGLLFTSPEPLSFDDIVGSLNMSRGSASQGLRMLRMIGAAKSTYVAGERRDYFLAEIELRKLVTGFLNEQVRPHLATGEERLAVLNGLAASEPESRRKILSERIHKLESWRSTTAAALPMVIGMLGAPERRGHDGALAT